MTRRYRPQPESQPWPANHARPCFPARTTSSWALLCLCLALGVPQGVAALELEQPADGPYGGMARISLENGETLIGEVTAVANAQNGLASILFHKDGKRRIGASEIRRLEVRKRKIEKVRPGFLVRGLPGGGLETSPTRRLSKIDVHFGTDSENEYWFKVVPQQDEQRVFDAYRQDNGDIRLLQVLNRAFDSRIQVYRKPIPVAGSFLDMERQRFVVIKDGGEPMTVDRKRYETAFVSLFGDCDVLTDYRKKERKFRHFAEHLFVYDRHCPAVQPSPDPESPRFDPS